MDASDRGPDEVSGVDMSRPAIDARLRRVAELSAQDWPDRAYVDMSREAVDGRLREVGEVSALVFLLQAAGAGLPVR
jgi:hypothetical protein